jgi:uncharacterized protein involved in exopolysaccharide biosynthesis
MGLVVELRHYYDVFRKRAWIIALVIVLAVGGTVIGLGRRPPQYRARVSVLVTPRVIAPTSFDDGGPNSQTPYFQLPSAYDETVVNNTIQLLRSKVLLRRVADRVGLSEDDLAGRVTRKEIFGTRFLVISAFHEDPAKAALIANTMAEEFSNFFAQINRAEATRSREFIEDRLNLARDRLRLAEGALLAFQTRTRTVAPSEEISRTVQRLLDVQATFDAARLDETVARTRVAAIQSQLRSQSDGRLASISIATNPIIAQVRDHLTGLELELANLRQVYTDQHYKVQALLGRIAEDRQRLSAEAEKVVNDQSLGSSPIREQFVREMVSAEVDAAAARARAGGIIPILGKLQARLASVPDEEIALGQYKRDVRVAEQLFTRLAASYQEAVIRESKAGSSGQAAIVVVDPASAPDEPVPSQLPKMATFAALLGLFVGAGLALVWESFDDRIRSSPQAEAAYGVPVLAAIPVMSARNYRYLTTAPGVAGILLPLLLVLTMMLGVVAAAYVARARPMPPSVVRFIQGQVDAFHVGPLAERYR